MMEGMTSICQRDGDVIYKKYFDETIEFAKDRNLALNWEKENIALEKLLGEEHVPQLIFVVDGVIEMSYCGERITKKTLPSNWHEQCAEIDAMQDKHEIYHLDLKLKNITVLKGVIYLIDWGMWSCTLSDKQSIFDELSKL